jgi:hypothetical protein
MIPAMIDRAPPTRKSQRQPPSTRPKDRSWLIPVMMKVTPAKMARTSRLPAL